MLDKLSKTRRNLALLALAVAVLWFCWTVRTALNPLMLGLLFAYILHPMVLKLERRGWSRRKAVNIIFGAFGAVVVLLTFAIVMQARALWRDVNAEDGALDRVRTQLKEIVASAEERATQIGLDLQALQGIPGQDKEAQEAQGETPAATEPQSQDEADAAGEATDETADAQPASEPMATPQGPPTADESARRTLVDELFDRAKEWAFSKESSGAAQASLQAAGGVWHTLEVAFGSLVTVLSLVFLVPLYTWFLLFELERISSFVVGYIPRDQRTQWSRIGGQMAGMLGAFFRGRMLVCLLKGLLLTATMAALGIPYSLLVGMLGGFLSLIPVVGPGVGYLLAFLLALLVHDPLGASWRCAIVFAVGELGEGYVLMPKVLGEQLGLPPVVVLASLMIFGSALGMFGLLLALPLTAGSVILAKELLLPALKQWAEDRGARTDGS
ncbi:MAG: AI-2E family transporter [Planctomycetaceae bacterium]|nr:AI-2E family transporter [Planctomycetaceae bacterium]